ncbi:MAG: class I SAM-dependent DNA methyltransferase [Bacteroidia bacterium]|nr:class I SAM-dependent DNA methyltransferase [Bacteroidia bacterium]
MITGELKSQVDRIWEAFWTGGISNPLTVIEQFTYLLFLRRLDDLQALEEKKASLAGIPMQRSFYPAAQQGLRWSQFRNLDPEAMYRLFTQPQPAHGGLTVFEHMKQIGAQGGVFAEHMKGATFMIPTPRLLDQVVQMISRISMDDRDTKGDLYEYLLSKIASAGTNGQFRTPRHIIRLMVALVQPTVHDTLCDPACGTAGFLVEAGEYFRHQEPSPFLDPAFREHFSSRMFSGIEFDPGMIRIAAMNLQLHGIETPALSSADALSEASAALRDRYSLILANPPFKGSLDFDAVEKSLLQTVHTKKTELLFIALILRLLRTGGRAAVIVPDGVLFGSSSAHRSLRETLVERHRLQAVISMPSGVFKPYAGVSTAILLFTKTGTGGTGDVWFYDMQSDGYSLDDKRNELATSDLGDIRARWARVQAGDAEELARPRTAQSFCVPKAEIAANGYDLSLNRYKQIEHTEQHWPAPQEILAEIRALDAQRAEILLDLEKLLG